MDRGLLKNQHFSIPPFHHSIKISGDYAYFKNINEIDPWMLKSRLGILPQQSFNSIDPYSSEEILREISGLPAHPVKTGPGSGFGNGSKDNPVSF